LLIKRQTAILSVQSVRNLFKEHVMAIAPSDPFEPISPTNCPTCRSGLQPTEPPYDDAVAGDY
jgi:hypothetical protein